MEHVKPARLPDKARRLIEEWKFGYAATVSPKGTFLVLDDETIAFAEIRSPNTIANISVKPDVEINFVDVFSRCGFRVRGKARFITRENDKFTAYSPRWQAIWGDELVALFNGLVLVSLDHIRPLQSPIYEIGGIESDLRRQWLQRFEDIQRSYLMEGDVHD